MKIGADNFRIVNQQKFRDVYSLRGFIGQGGYGKVYRVMHRKSKEVRAMKSTKSLNKLVLSKQKVKNGEEMLQEFNILRAMDHPNIVRLFELFEDKKHYYLVTE